MWPSLYRLRWELMSVLLTIMYNVTSCRTILMMTNIITIRVPILVTYHERMFPHRRERSNTTCRELDHNTFYPPIRLIIQGMTSNFKKVHFLNLVRVAVVVPVKHSTQHMVHHAGVTKCAHKLVQAKSEECIKRLLHAQPRS